MTQKPMVDRSLAAWSETRLIVENGKVTRMGILMPGAENDLRIPAYLRKQIQTKGEKNHGE